jgi:arginine:ornithine antiporter/lysine permease
VSVGGAFLAWTLLCAEIPYVCGKDGTFPKWFAGENAAGSPVNSLWVTEVDPSVRTTGCGFVVGSSTVLFS